MQLSHLMCKLMTNHHSNPNFTGNAGRVRINKKARLPVGGQTPVFHRTALEVRDGDQICDEQEEEEEVGGLPRQKQNKAVPCFGRG